MQTKSKRVLHVGCGGATLSSLPPYFQSGDWDEVRLDIDEAANPDVLGSILDMGLIQDRTFDALYSSHNIEHVYPHEVSVALLEFSRVLKNDGIAVIACPDIQSVAQAVASGNLMFPLYVSPAGPISAIDIMYGHRASLASGNLFMAHRTAFTADALGSQLKEASFETVLVARDKMFGLHAVAFRKAEDNKLIESICSQCMPNQDALLEILKY